MAHSEEGMNLVYTEFGRNGAVFRFPQGTNVFRDSHSEALDSIPTTLGTIVINTDAMAYPV